MTQQLRSVALTAFHAKPGETIDQSQSAPVKLTKHNRTYAVVVSADWFARAEAAIDVAHGNRRLLDAHDLSDGDRDFIMRSGPSAEEIKANEWQA